MTNPSNPLNDLAGTSEQLADLAQRSGRLVEDFLRRQQAGGHQIDLDPMGVSQAFQTLAAQMLADPGRLMQAQLQAWQSYAELWQSSGRRMLGMDADAVVEPRADDRRFIDEAWTKDPLFDFIKQSYLIAANTINETVVDTQGVDEKSAQKVAFYTNEFVNAMAPGNFALTNPQVLAETRASGGQNLLDGLSNLLSDLERGQGELRIKMTDPDAFELGKNIALTPAKVVFQNALMQLLQYEPTTTQVHRRPLFIVPPWINKYYILDLRPKNSFIRWAVEQGHTVFVISWVNPDEKLAHKGFDDYLFEGPLAALQAIEAATGEREVNAIGYCLGGTLLAATLAYMKAKKDKRITSATFFVSMIDFAEPGDLGVFIDEKRVSQLEAVMAERGYLEGKSMANTFNMLRSNDLIWWFVINNYLLGKEPFPFDLLYWNSDSTRLPAAMHSFYLRKMYLENVFKEKGGITVDGVPIDVGAIKVPSIFVSTREDHIAPWKSTYAGAQLFAGPVTFLLGMSGHIAGIVNPPAAEKYGYWVSEEMPAQAQQWLAQAQEHAGSWWPHWDGWLRQYAAEEVPARQPGDGALDVIEDAPGAYVKVSAA